MPVEGSGDYELAAQIFGGQSFGNRVAEKPPCIIKVSKPPYPWINRSRDQWKLQVSRDEVLSLIHLSSPPQEIPQMVTHLKRISLESAFDTYWMQNPKYLQEDLNTLSKKTPKKSAPIQLTEDLTDLYKIFSTPELFDYLNFIRRIREERGNIRNVYSAALTELNSSEEIEQSVESGRIQILNFFIDQRKKGGFSSLTNMSEQQIQNKVESTYFEPLLVDLYQTLVKFSAEEDLTQPNRSLLNVTGLKSVFRQESIYQQFQSQYYKRRHLLPPALQTIGDTAFERFQERKKVVEKISTTRGIPKNTISSSLWELLKELIQDDQEFNKPRNPNSTVAILQRRALFQKALGERTLISQLTKERVQVMQLYSEGLSGDQIAEQLKITRSDVNYHLRDARLIAQAHFGYFKD